MVFSPVVRRRSAFCVLFLLLPVLSERAGAQTPLPVTIKSVRLSPSPAGPVVTIESDGPLPQPALGEVDGPPRVFLDFPGVRTAARSVTQPVGAVKRVRIALHNANPPSTRVVLDLERLQPVSLDTSATGAGRLLILVGGSSPSLPASPKPALPEPPLPPATTSPAVPTPPPPKPPSNVPESKPAPDKATPEKTPPSVPADAAVRPVPQLGSETPPATTSTPPPPPPSSVAPPPAVPKRSAAAKIPPRDAERYREQVGPSLDRLRAMRDLLVAVDQQQPLPSVTEHRTEISGILRTLNTVKASEVVRGTHDLLVRSASLALMALTLRDTPPGDPPDQEALRNAASAAAGALLLLDRVCMEIGCTAA